MRIFHKKNLLFHYLVSLLGIFFISTTAAITQERGSNNNKARFDVIANIGVEEARTDSEKPYVFYLIHSIDCDKKGNIYVLDGKANCIKIFEKNGKFIRKILQYGKGPNEISNAYNLCINPFTGNIIVLQEHGYQLKEFDSSGKYVSVFTLPEQIFHSFTFLEKDRFLYIAMGRYGENEYDNFKILNLKSRKVEKKFAHTKRNSFSNAYQTFVVDKGILWTCPGDMMELIGYELDTGKVVTGSSWRIIFIYNYAQPIFFADRIYILVTKQDFPGETRDAVFSPRYKNLRLYLLDDQKLKWYADLPEGDFMQLGTTWENRIILYSLNPYPRIRILEMNH